MRRSAILVILLAGCSPRLPDAGETQIALEQFYLARRPTDEFSNRIVARCAPITDFRIGEKGDRVATVMVRFGALPSGERGKGNIIWQFRMRLNEGRWTLAYAAAAEELPCIYQKVAEMTDVTAAGASWSVIAGRPPQKSLLPNRATP